MANSPKFRADHVGSLLRPEALLDTRQAAKLIDPDHLALSPQCGFASIAQAAPEA